MGHQVEGVSLQGRVLQDVELRQRRMRRRVKAVAPAEASMRSEHARREDVPAKNQTKEVVAHELKVGGVWKKASRDFFIISSS